MKSNLKRLQKKAENLWKEYCLKRDRRVCQVKRFFPGIQIAHTNIMQVDHCFSRTNKHLFVSVKNGTCVCSACNMAKGFGQKSIARAVDSIVIMREGKEAWEAMLKIDQAKSVNNNWKSIPHLEETIKQLEILVKQLTTITQEAL